MKLTFNPYITTSNNQQKSKLNEKNRYVTMPMKNDVVQFSNSGSYVVPSFSGWFDWMKSEVDVNIPIETLTPEKIAKKKQKVSEEIVDIITYEASEISSQKLDRLKTLMKSDYIDYSIKTKDDITLNDCLFRHPEYKSKAYYYFFLLETLAEHNQEIDLKKRNSPTERINEFHKVIYYDLYEDIYNEDVITAKKVRKAISFMLSDDKHNSPKVKQECISAFFKELDLIKTKPKLFNEILTEMKKKDALNASDILRIKQAVPNWKNYISDEDTRNVIKSELGKINSNGRYVTIEQKPIEELSNLFFASRANKTVGNIIEMAKGLPPEKENNDFTFEKFVLYPLINTIHQEHELKAFLETVEREIVENGQSEDNGGLDVHYLLTSSIYWLKENRKWKENIYNQDLFKTYFKMCADYPSSMHKQAYYDSLMLARINGKQPQEDLPQIEKVNQPQIKKEEKPQKTVVDLHSIILHKLKNGQYDPTDAELLLKYAEQINFASVAKELKENKEDFQIPLETQRYFAKLLNDGKDKERISNLYRQVFENEGKIDFTHIVDNRDFVKLFLDINLDPKKDYGHGSLYAKMLSSANAKSWNLFPIEDFVEDFVEIENKDTQKDQFMKLLQTSNGSFETFFAKYKKVMDKLNNMGDAIDSVEVRDTESAAFAEYKKYYNARMAVNNAYTGIVECQDFNKDEIVAEIRKCIEEYTVLEKKVSKTRALDNVKLCWQAIKDDKIKEELIDELLPLGIENFDFKYPILRKAVDKSVAYFIQKYPGIGDGLCSLGDFYVLSSPYYEYIKSGDGLFLNIPINDNKETLMNVFIDINCETENKKEVANDIIKQMEKDYYYGIDWNHKDKFGTNYALHAVTAENIPVIKMLLKRKDTQWAATNQFGKNALEEARKSPNPEVRELLKDVKTVSPELFQFVRQGLASGVERCLKKDYIDINAQDQYGANVWWLAANSGNPEVVEMLSKRSDLDFSNVAWGRTFAMEALKRSYERSISGDFIPEVFPKLTGEQLGLNQIVKDASGVEHSIYSQFLDCRMYGNLDKYWETIVNHKDANPNICSENHPPIAFTLISRGNKDFFNTLAMSGKLDLNLTYKGETLNQFIMSNINSPYKQAEFLKILEVAAGKSMVSKIKDLVNENGILSLENIKEILNYPSANSIIKDDMSYNGEKIGHLLADISLEDSNIQDIVNLSRKILSMDRDAFIYRDNYGQSPAEKALWAENDVLFEIIAQNSKFTSVDIEKLNELADNIDNPRIKRIVSRLNPQENR